jgi:hypothetical protein
MDNAGFNATRIVCGDDSHVFSCAATAASDPSLRDIIVALGSHGPQVCGVCVCVLRCVRRRSHGLTSKYFREMIPSPRAPGSHFGVPRPTSPIMEELI